MPSLKQLEEFQKSFLRTGNELDVRNSLNQRPEEYALPETEPTGPDPFAEDQGEDFSFDDDGGPEVPSPGDAGAAADEPADEGAVLGDEGLLDFSSFLDTLPDDFSGQDEAVPETGESPAGEAPVGEASFDEPFPGEPPAAGDAPAPDDPFAGIDNEPAPDGEPADGEADGGFAAMDDFGAMGEEDSFSIPEDLLFGFAEDVEAGRATGDEGIAAGDLGSGADSPEVPEPFDAGDFGLGDDAAGAEGGDAAGELPDFDVGDLGGEDTGAGAEGGGEAPDDSAFDLGEDAFNFGGDGAPAPDAGFPTESPAGDAAEPGGVGDDDLDFSTSELADGETPPDWGETPPDDAAAPDSFDAFDLEEGATNLAVDIGATVSGGDSGAGTVEDFSLSGLDDIIKGNAVKLPTEPAAEEKGKRPGRKGGRGAAPVEPEINTVEEINLSESDFVKLQDTLASYPPNLRIAIEEIIAEQVIAPDLLSSLLRLLIRGAPAKDAAAMAGKILGRTIPIPRGYEKSTGAELEAKQASFSYIFIRKFLPFLGVFVSIALAVMSLVFLIYQFIYIPVHARNLYRLGYERIAAGEYERANERFSQAFNTHRVKNWFYRYAEAFRDERQYRYAEQKYDELLRAYPRDKKGALDYADLETTWRRNYEEAERILKTNILDYAPDDEAGLTALGDTNLAWGESNPARYEEARHAYARLLERYGWKDPIVERMMLYFIRTDNLGEVLPLEQHFDASAKRKISPRTLAELGGYLLDKRLEEPVGVPDENVPRIQGLRNLLLRALNADPALPESHYHLARYYHEFGSPQEERMTLNRALNVFDTAPEESARRIAYHIDAERRMAQTLTGAGEFMPAEEHLVRGIGLYEDALSRQRLDRHADFGRLYADLGDLEYFTKTGDMETALSHYQTAEVNGWRSPEMQYRMGSASYHLGRWEDALNRFFAISTAMPRNRKLLHALGNVSYERGNYHAAQGYYRRLLDLLTAERSRFPVLYPNDRPDHLELAERLMVTQNNLGAALEALTVTTGDPSYRARALGFYTESDRAWDALTRNPDTMVRAGAGELSTPGINMAYLNSRNLLYPQPGYEPQLYIKIDRDVLEPSLWDDLVPQGYRISELE